MGFCEYLTGTPAPPTSQQWLDSIDVELVTLLDNWFMAGLDTTFGSVQTFSSFKSELSTLETQVLPLYGLTGSGLDSAVATAKTIVDPIIANLKLITAKTILAGQPRLTTECQQISTLLKFYKANNANTNLNPANLITAMQEANRNRAVDVYPSGQVPMAAFANAFLEAAVPSLSITTVDDAITYAEAQEARCSHTCTGGAAMETLCLAVKTVDVRLNTLLDYTTAASSHDALFAEIDTVITSTTETLDAAAAWTSAYTGYTTAGAGLELSSNDTMAKALIQLTMGSFYLNSSNSDLFSSDVLDTSDLAAFYQFVLKSFIADGLKTKINDIAKLSYEYGVQNAKTSMTGNLLSIADFNTALTEVFTNLKTIYACADAACRVSAMDSLPSTFFGSYDDLMSYDGLTATPMSNTDMTAMVNPTYFFEMESMEFNSSEASMKSAITFAAQSITSKHGYSEQRVSKGVSDLIYALCRQRVIDSDLGASNEGDIDDETRATVVYSFISELYNNWTKYQDSTSDAKYRCSSHTANLYLGDDLCFSQKMLLPQWNDAVDDIGGVPNVDIVGSYAKMKSILESANSHITSWLSAEAFLDFQDGEKEVLAKVIDEYTNASVVTYEHHAELGFVFIRLLHPTWNPRQGFGPSVSCTTGKGNYYRPVVTDYASPTALTTCENTILSLCAFQKEVVLRDLMKGYLVSKGTDADFIKDWQTEYGIIKPTLADWISTGLTYAPAAGHTFTMGASFNIPFRTQAALIFHHITAAPMVAKSAWSAVDDFVKFYKLNLDLGAELFIGSSHTEELQVYRLMNQSHAWLYGHSDIASMYASQFTSPTAVLDVFSTCSGEWYCDSPTLYTNLNTSDTVISLDFMGTTTHFAINNSSKNDWATVADPMTGDWSNYEYSAWNAYALHLVVPNWDTFCTTGCSAAEQIANQVLIDNVKDAMDVRLGDAVPTSGYCY